MILTLRTDKPEAEIGLFDNANEQAYRKWQAHRQLSETIHTTLLALLDERQKTYRHLTGIVVYRGPGSFTGLRIGISVANALAYGLDIPVTATTGPDWIQQGLTELLDDRGGRTVLPEYGSPVHVTQPKK